MFSVSPYYKLKGFERDYIPILRLSQKKKINIVYLRLS